ncbi:MAG: type II toxin-antitoxin system VapC family toxin [Deltaproteobacteria bacterium]|nr:type II toxin-antitoxin system VapC family toxin [Deltaproteobacteria bacterium]
MRLLLDTHVLLWWLDGDENLSLTACAAIGNPRNVNFVSAATAWEISTKARIGKLPGALDVARDVAGAVASQGFQKLDITIEDANLAGSLPGHHRDPFDRMLVAQSVRRMLTIVSADGQLDAYGVRRIW